MSIKEELFISVQTISGDVLRCVCLQSLLGESSDDFLYRDVRVSSNVPVDRSYRAQYPFTCRLHNFVRIQTREERGRLLKLVTTYGDYLRAH